MHGDGEHIQCPRAAQNPNRVQQPQKSQNERERKGDKRKGNESGEAVRGRAGEKILVSFFQRAKRVGNIVAAGKGKQENGNAQPNQQQREKAEWNAKGGGEEEKTHHLSHKQWRERNQPTGQRRRMHVLDKCLRTEPFDFENPHAQQQAHGCVGKLVKHDSGSQHPTKLQHNAFGGKLLKSPFAFFSNMKTLYKVVLVLFVLVLVGLFWLNRFDASDAKWNALNEKYGLDDSLFLPTSSAGQALYEQEALKLEAELRLPWNDSRIADLTGARVHWLNAVWQMQNAQEFVAKDSSISPSCAPSSNYGKARQSVETALQLMQKGISLQEKIVQNNGDRLPVSETNALQAMRALEGQWKNVLRQLQDQCAGKA